MSAEAETGDTERLEQEAEVEKQRLLRTIDQLAEKKHRIDGAAVALARHGTLAEAIVGGVLVALAAVGIHHFVRRRRGSTFGARLDAVKRMWAHPERVAR